MYWAGFFIYILDIFTTVSYYKKKVTHHIVHLHPIHVELLMYCKVSSKVCLGPRESTARRDVQYTSAASCRVCCTENSFPHDVPAHRTAPPSSQNFQTSNRATPSMGDRLPPPPPCVALNLTTRRCERPTFAAPPLRPSPAGSRAHCHGRAPEWS